MHHYSALIKALEEETRYYDNLFTRAREILNEENVKFAKQQFTDSTKELVRLDIITKEKKENKTYYSLNRSKQEAVSFIMDISDGEDAIKQNKEFLKKCIDTIKKIKNSKVENNEELLFEVTDNLINLCQFMFAILTRITFIKFQVTGLAPFTKELDRHEKETQKTLNEASDVMKKLGNPYVSKFLKNIESGVTRNVSRRYNRLTKNSAFFY